MPDERAAELADWLRAEVPEGTDVAVRPRLEETASPVFVFARGAKPGILRDLGL